MSRKSDRREAARQARRLAKLVPAKLVPDTKNPATISTTQTAESNPQTPVSDTTSARRPISDAQLRANRANAQHSTGPTPAGREKSSQNSLKHGLTAKTALLPGEDPADYAARLQSLSDLYKPATDEERVLLQSILDCEWRLNRITQIEASIQFKGELEFKDKFQDHTPAERFHLIKAETYLKYEKPLRNLNIQEARLRRTLDKSKTELKKLQAFRFQQEFAARQAAENAQSRAPKPSPTTRHPQNGFVFSTSESQPTESANQTTKTHREAA